MKRMLSAVAAAIALFFAAAGEGREAPPDDGVAALDRIQVTGTRVRTDDMEHAFPIQVLGRQEIRESGHASLGELLGELPSVTGSPFGTQSNQRGSGGGLSRGASRIELRGLEPERTLVLVNGRRMVPGGNGADGAVDLNMIPIAMIARVEVLQTGASVAYGADAVAGVVNVVTRNDFTGLEAGANIQATTRGDGEVYGANAIFGRSLDRGHLVIGAEYTEQERVKKDARSFSEQLRTVAGPDNAIVPFGSSAPPNGQFRTSDGALTLIEGRPGDRPADFRPFTDADRFNFNPFEDLVQPSERFSLFAMGQYDLTADTRIYAESLFHRRDSSQEIAPLPFFTRRERGVLVSVDNVFNPFGEDIIDARRRLVEAGPRTFEQEVETWRWVLGIQGRFAGDWQWDLAFNRARNTTDQHKTGDLRDSRLALALGPSFGDGSGQAVCGTPAQPIDGCAPLNLFGGPGSITPEMLGFVQVDLADSGFNEQNQVTANIAGQVDALDAGALELAFGYEYRDESGGDFPDPLTRAGDTTGGQRGATAGDFQSSELYGEAALPLYRNLDAGRELVAHFGGRVADFSRFGSTTLLEGGLRFRPVPDVILRGAVAEAFRAPNIAELFGGVQEAEPAIRDACGDFAALEPTEVQRCIAQGVPADGSFQQQREEVRVRVGGNPRLEPEEATVSTLGLTYEPAAILGLRATLDYYRIEIDDAIAAVGAQTALDRCLATGSPDFCGMIERFDDGAIDAITSRQRNIAEETAEGIDLRAEFDHGVGGGRLSHHLAVSYLMERDLVPFAGAESLTGAGRFDRDNFGALPRWRGNYRLRWNGGPWRIGYEAQWIGSLTESGGEIFPGTRRDISQRVYHDLFAERRFGEQATLTLGIDNITDADPPFFATAAVANTDVATYRLLGATAWARFSFRTF